MILVRLVHVVWLLLAHAVLLGSCSASDEALARLLEEVENAERLYENVSVNVSSVYRISEFNKKEYPSRTNVFLSEWKMRQTSLGDRYRIDIDGFSESLNGKQCRDRVCAFDGKTSRLLEQGVIGNISPARRVDWHLFRPHALLLMDLEPVEPLSIRMQGSEAVRAYSPTTRHYGRMHCNHRGDDVIGGRPCQKIEFVTLDEKTGELSWRQVLWLAEDRNFLPIRMENFEAFSKDKYLTYAEAKQLDEVAPGIWVPSQVEIVHYDGFEFRKNGRQEIGWTQNISVSDVNFISEADPRTFSEVQFPRLAVMYELDVDGKVLRSWQEGVEPVSVPERVGASPLLWMIAGSVGLAIIAFFALRQRARPIQSSTSR